MACSDDIEDIHLIPFGLAPSSVGGYFYNTCELKLVKDAIYKQARRQKEDQWKQAK